MKGVLFFAALVIGLALYTLGHFGAVAGPILDRIVTQEGSVDDMQNAAQKDGFAAKYKTSLDQRFWLGRVALIMDDDTFLKISGDSHDRYAGTPLQNDPEFGYLIFNRADLLAARNQFQDAGTLYEQYISLFPQGEYYGAARGAIMNLRINHGIQ